MEGGRVEICLKGVVKKQRPGRRGTPNLIPVPSVTTNKSFRFVSQKSQAKPISAVHAVNQSQSRGNLHDVGLADDATVSLESFVSLYSSLHPVDRKLRLSLPSAGTLPFIIVSKDRSTTLEVALNLRYTDRHLEHASTMLFYVVPSNRYVIYSSSHKFLYFLQTNTLFSALRPVVGVSVLYLGGGVGTERGTRWAILSQLQLSPSPILP